MMPLTHKRTHTASLELGEVEVLVTMCAHSEEYYMSLHTGELFNTHTKTGVT